MICQKTIDKSLFDVIIVRVSDIHFTFHAGMAELADALDLGSSVIDVGVQVLFPAPD